MLASILFFWTKHGISHLFQITYIFFVLVLISKWRNIFELSPGILALYQIFVIQVFINLHSLVSMCLTNMMNRNGQINSWSCFSRLKPSLWPTLLGWCRLPNYEERYPDISLSSDLHFSILTIKGAHHEIWQVLC